MLKAYLAGYIHGEVIEQCLAWRKKIPCLRGLLRRVR